MSNTEEIKKKIQEREAKIEPKIKFLINELEKIEHTQLVKEIKKRESKKGIFNTRKSREKNIAAIIAKYNNLNKTRRSRILKNYHISNKKGTHEGRLAEEVKRIELENNRRRNIRSNEISDLTATEKETLKAIEKETHEAIKKLQNQKDTPKSNIESKVNAIIKKYNERIKTLKSRILIENPFIGITNIDELKIRFYDKFTILPQKQDMGNKMNKIKNKKNKTQLYDFYSTIYTLKRELIIQFMNKLISLNESQSNKKNSDLSEINTRLNELNDKYTKKLFPKSVKLLSIKKDQTYNTKVGEQYYSTNLYIHNILQLYKDDILNHLDISKDKDERVEMYFNLLNGKTLKKVDPLLSYLIDEIHKVFNHLFLYQSSSSGDLVSSGIGTIASIAAAAMLIKG